MSRTLVFQIGHNKCATTALFKLFLRAGSKALHSNGRHWRHDDHPALRGIRPQELIAQNIAAGRPPVRGLEDFDSFFDMEWSRREVQYHNYLHFDAFARAYPDAIFILNLRERKRWLRSRARHLDGVYLENACTFHGLDTETMLKKWGDDFDRHNDQVRKFFADAPERLVVFDIDTDPISEVVQRLAPVVGLDARFWLPMRVTDIIAQERNWHDRNRNLFMDEADGIRRN